MKNFNDINLWPAFLNVSEIASIMRISKPIAYSLVHRDDFPAIRVSDRRYVIPKDKFILWLEKETAVNRAM